jgi:hypothetical protein
MSESVLSNCSERQIYIYLLVTTIGILSVGLL